MKNRVSLLYTKSFRELFLNFINFFNSFVPYIYCFLKNFFGHFLRFAFNHHHSIRCPGNNKLKVARFNIFIFRINNKFAVYSRDSHGRDRPQERNIGNSQRGRSANYCQYIRIVFLISRKHRANYLNLVKIPFREQRPDRPVSKTRGQNFLFCRPSFPFYVSPRKPAGGISIFSVIHC